jgi:tetratricopeptide (TPR) repeat protein
MHRQLVLIPAAALVLVGVSGCAIGRHTDSATTRALMTPEARREALFPKLKKLAAKQASRPAESASIVAPPPGLDPALAQSVSDAAKDAGARAMVPLASAIETFAARAEMPTIAAAPAKDEGDDEDDDERQENAARDYISGRQKLLSNDVAGAVIDLREATKLDPGAHEPWRELGEAYLAGGSRSEALEAFRAAVARGETSPRTLELLARAAAERGDNVQAAAWYAKSSQNDPERFDPILSQVVYVGLSQSLRKEGYLTASKDALRRALMANGTLSSSTRYGREAGEVFRRQGDLWRDVGDDELRLGQFDLAMQAFERADDFPSVDGQPLTPRYVFAAVRAGQAASGALYVLEAMADRNGRVAAGDLSMLRYLAAIDGLSSAITSDIDGMRDAFPTPLPPSIVSSLARAKAAAQGEGEARKTLATALRANPGDEHLAAALIGTFGDADLAVEHATSLVDADAKTAIPLAEALLNSELDLAALSSSIARRRTSTGGLLLGAYFTALQGRAAEAAVLVEAMASKGSPDLALAYADLKFASGGVVPSSLIDSLRGKSGVESRRALARVLAFVQRSREALDVAEPLVDGPDTTASASARIADLMFVAELRAALGNGEGAEALVRRAAALDPFDDRPVSMLLTLLGPGGAASAPGKLNAVIRDLRTTLPDSRTARVLRAREALRRSLFALAEREAMSLVADDPSDTAAIDTLVSVWQRSQTQQGAGVVTRGIAWLEHNLARRPQSAAPLAGLASLLIAQEKGDAAAQRLRAAMAQGAGPDVSRTLEHVLRDELKRPAEADDATRSRVEPAPRTIPATFEYADLLVRGGQPAQAADAVLGAITPDITLIGDQPQRLLALAGALIQVVAKDQGDSQGDTPSEPSATAARALSLLNLALDHGMRLSPELHQARLVLMAQDRKGAREDLVRAIQLVKQQYPEQAAAQVHNVLASLRASDRNADALWLCEQTASTITPTVNLATDWLVFQTLAGDATRAKQMIDRLADLHDDGLVRSALEQFIQSEQVGSSKDLRAETAYVLGILAGSEGREEFSLQAYELALQYQPDHPWAANNLGYALADKGRDIEHAAKLLEIAYNALPDEASIVDSLGWLRYKQNMLEDRKDAGSGVTTRGAVSLLAHAADLLDGKPGGDATVLEHAGDASWLAGHATEALQYWKNAQAQTQGLIDLAARPPQARPGAKARVDQPVVIAPARLAEARKIHDSVSEKIKSASRGGPVRVSPQFQSDDPRPTAIAPAPGGASANPAMRDSVQLVPPLAPRPEASNESNIVAVPYALPEPASHRQ